MTWSRRAAIALVVGGGGATLLAACAPLSPAAAPATPPAAAPAATSVSQTGPTQPRSGGTLRTGLLGDIPSLDPHITGGQDSLHRVWEVVNVLDDKLNTVPVLADSLDLTPDARQITLKVRQGVQFHTGRQLTADDLIWNFNRLKDPKLNPTLANLVKPFASMEALDAATLRIQFDAPDPFVMDALPNLTIADPVTFQQDGAGKPVGTGPYTFVEWVQGDHVTLKKNPNYWDSGKPYLDMLEFRIFSDPQAMISEFEAGTLDVAIQPALVDWVRLRQAGNVQALNNPNSGNYLGMTFNVTQPPTNNKLVRQALQFALDRQRISDTVYQSVEKPLTLLWFPTSPAYDPAKNQTYAFSLEKAQALLNQAATGDVALDFNYASVAPEIGQVGQIWQGDLAKIGVKLTLKPTDPVALAGEQQRQQYNGVSLGTGFYGQLHGGVVWTSPYFGPVNNWSGFRDDTYTQLSLTVYSEADANKRKPAYDAWNDYVLDQSFVTAVVTQYPRALAKPNVQGLVYAIGGNYLDLSKGWLS